MFEITKRALDAALAATQANRTASLNSNARGAVEQMQWIAAQGAAARILGALADGVTPTEASLSTGVSMKASPLANMCEFVALTDAGLDPGVARQSVGELDKDDIASAVEVWGRERDRIRSLARILQGGRRLDYVWFAMLAAYGPAASRTELHAALSKWTGISFERIFAARSCSGHSLTRHPCVKPAASPAICLPAKYHSWRRSSRSISFSSWAVCAPGDKRETDQPGHGIWRGYTHHLGRLDCRANRWRNAARRSVGAPPATSLNLKGCREKCSATCSPHRFLKCTSALSPSAFCRG